MTRRFMQHVHDVLESGLAAQARLRPPGALSIAVDCTRDGYVSVVVNGAAPAGSVRLKVVYRLHEFDRGTALRLLGSALMALDRQEPGMWSSCPRPRKETT